MPSTNMKVKSGSSYPVKYKVEGSLDTLTTEQRNILAERYLRTTARNYVMAKLNEAEPAIVTHKVMHEKMLKVGMGTPEQVDAFFKEMGMVLEIPSEFTIPISELVPNTEGGRGKKAADIFSFEEEEGEEEATAE